MQFVRNPPASSEGDVTTRERVARAILENGPSTAVDLAAHLHLTPAAVRRHLDLLGDQGVVESREQRVHGSRGRGRPARVFALTESGRAQSAQPYDALAGRAPRFIGDNPGRGAVMDFARQRVAFIEHEYARVAQANPELSAAEVLAKVFSAEGYAATVKSLPVVGEQLCQQHCPVSHVAHEFPQLCEAETEAISKVLGTHVQRLATIAHGDGVCTTCIPQIPHQNPTKEHP